MLLGGTNTASIERNNELAYSNHICYHHIMTKVINSIQVGFTYSKCRLSERQFRKQKIVIRYLYTDIYIHRNNVIRSCLRIQFGKLCIH